MTDSPSPAPRPRTLPAPLDPPVPVLVAPMAGGPSTPELVAAVVRAGGGGFLAGGMRTAAQVREQVDRLRELLAAPSTAPAGPDPRRGGPEDWPTRFGVNLFVPDAVSTALPAEARTPEARSARAAAVAAFRERLAPLAADLEAPLPSAEDVTPDPDAEQAAFEDMLTTAEEQSWPAVSFTFGLPEPAVFARLAAAGIPAGVTVTSIEEARAAVANGAVFLVVQGPKAGGHRATLDPQAQPGITDLRTLVFGVRHVLGADAVPVVAAGGITGIAQVRSLLEAGAVAVSAGTAFLLTPQAGTSEAHRTALRACTAGSAFADHDDGGASTALTRAYTGRWARGLETPFMDAFADAPAAYPEVNGLTGPLRAAAAARGDLEHVHLWAGTGAHRVLPLDAAQVLASLAPWGR